MMLGMVYSCAERSSMMNIHSQQSVEALTHFREQVTAARRQAGYLQKDLSAALRLDTETLSRKLHGRHHAILTLQDVKQIIKTLAAWQAITRQEEALDLLELLRLSLGLSKHSVPRPCSPLQQECSPFVLPPEHPPCFQQPRPC